METLLYWPRLQRELSRNIADMTAAILFFLNHIYALTLRRKVVKAGAAPHGNKLIQCKLINIWTRKASATK